MDNVHYDIRWSDRLDERFIDDYIALQNEIEENIYKEQAACLINSGNAVSFLAETCRDGVITGHTDNFFEVRVYSDVPIDKEIRSIRIVGSQGLSLIGEIL